MNRITRDRLGFQVPVLVLRNCVACLLVKSGEMLQPHKLVAQYALFWVDALGTRLVLIAG